MFVWIHLNKNLQCHASFPLKAAKNVIILFIFLFICIVFIVPAATMALCQRVLIAQWVITVHLGLGPNTSTRVQLDP